MFGHIFSYRLKSLIRNKSLIFWTFIFPILLASFFKMALSGLSEGNPFRAIGIAIVNDTEYQKDQNFQAVMKELSSGDDRFFNLTLTDESEAKELLESGSITGYILAGDEMTLIVKDSGLSQSIIKSFLDQYNQTAHATGRILSENPEALRDVLAVLENPVNHTLEVPLTNSPLDPLLNFFYALIAMTCLYGGFFGMEEINLIQADLTTQAARVNTAPVHKLKTFVYSACAAVLIQFTELLILMAYMTFALSIDFGSKTGFVLLTIFVGTLLGVSFGAFVSSLVKGGEGIKTAILLSVSMTGAFLAGMMLMDMKYIIATKAPLLTILNPVNLITDAFYALYIYDTYTRYAGNMIGMLIFTLIFSLTTYALIRRRKYASL